MLLKLTTFNKRFIYVITWYTSCTITVAEDKNIIRKIVIVLYKLM